MAFASRIGGTFLEQGSLVSDVLVNPIIIAVAFILARFLFVALSGLVTGRCGSRVGDAQDPRCSVCWGSCWHSVFVLVRRAGIAGH